MPEDIVPDAEVCNSCTAFSSYTAIGGDGNDPNECSGTVTYTDGTNEIDETTNGGSQENDGDNGGNDGGDTGGDAPSNAEI